MDRLLLGSLIVTLLGLVLLGGLAAGSEPPTVPLDQIGDEEGHKVCVEAILRMVRSFEGGAVRLLLVRANQSVAAFAPFSAAATPGDHVRACGTVERTTASYELRLRTPADLRVLAKWTERLTPLAMLSREPWIYLDQNVITLGRAEAEPPKGYLADEASRTRLRLVPWPEPATIGERIMVGGLVEFDPEESLFRLRVQTVTILDGPPGG